MTDLRAELEHADAIGDAPRIREIEAAAYAGEERRQSERRRATEAKTLDPARVLKALSLSWVYCRGCGCTTKEGPHDNERTVASLIRDCVALIGASDA